MIEVYLKITYDYGMYFICYRNLTKITLDRIGNECTLKTNIFDNTLEMLDNLELDGKNEDIKEISKEEFLEQYNIIKEKIEIINL